MALISKHILGDPPRSTLLPTSNMFLTWNDLPPVSIAQKVRDYWSSPQVKQKYLASGGNQNGLSSINKNIDLQYSPHLNTNISTSQSAFLPIHTSIWPYGYTTIGINNDNGLIQRAIAHEFGSHQALQKNENMSPGMKEAYRRVRKPFFSGSVWKSTSGPFEWHYYTNPAEIHARLMETRQAQNKWGQDNDTLTMKDVIKTFEKEKFLNSWLNYVDTNKLKQVMNKYP